MTARIPRKEEWTPARQAQPGARVAALPRQHRHEPIVPAKDGKPPAWVVACLDCGFAHDAHGLDANDAIASLAAAHQPGHRLIARPIDYTDHPLYQ